MKTKRRILCLLLALICAFSMLITFAYASETSKNEPLRYTGISSITAGLTISNTGCATCSGSASAYTGYSVDLTMKLLQDGSTIKTWTTSGDYFVPLTKQYYVTSGHNYQVLTSVKVYDSNDTYIATYSIYSNVKTY